MTSMTELSRVNCPYCGELIDLVADASAGSQHYIEDCPVCCRPMRVWLEVDDETGDPSLQVAHEDEA